MQFVLPIDTAVSVFPAVMLSRSAAFYIRTGQSVHVPSAPTAGFLRLYSEKNEFMGIGEMDEHNRVAPRRLLSTLANG